jgi:hypothetical protein
MGEKPHHRAWFRSIRDHEETYPLDQVVYQARDGALLEVVHDMDELAKTSASEWKRLFRDRAHSTEWPYGSGVWGKKEWVLPGVDHQIAARHRAHERALQRFKSFRLRLLHARDVVVDSTGSTQAAKLCFTNLRRDLLV